MKYVAILLYALGLAALVVSLIHGPQYMTATDAIAFLVAAGVTDLLFGRPADDLNRIEGTPPDMEQALW